MKETKYALKAETVLTSTFDGISGRHEFRNRDVSKRMWQFNSEIKLEQRCPLSVALEFGPDWFSLGCIGSRGGGDQVYEE